MDVDKSRLRLSAILRRVSVYTEWYDITDHNYYLWC